MRELCSYYIFTSGLLGIEGSHPTRIFALYSQSVRNACRSNEGGPDHVETFGNEAGEGRVMRFDISMIIYITWISNDMWSIRHLNFGANAKAISYTEKL